MTKKVIFLLLQHGINVIAYKGTCSNNGTFSISSTSDITEVDTIYDKGIFDHNGILSDIFNAHFQDNFMIPSSNIKAEYTSSLMSVADSFALHIASGTLNKIGIDTDFPYAVLSKEPFPFITKFP